MRELGRGPRKADAMDDPQRTPKQARSRESQRRILEATLSLLDDRHFEDLTIADIAADAGMAVGNFYKRFKNKEALLPHLYAEYNRRFSEFSNSLQSQHPARPWHLTIKETVAFFKANRGLIRALHLHSRLNPELVPEGSTQTRARVYQALEPLVAKRGISASGRQQRAGIASLVLVSTITEAVLYPDMTPYAATGLDEAQLIDGLTKLLESY